jgi:hypothetical protein
LAGDETAGGVDDAAVGAVGAVGSDGVGGPAGRTAERRRRDAAFGGPAAAFVASPVGVLSFRSSSSNVLSSSAPGCASQGAPRGSEMFAVRRRVAACGGSQWEARPLPQVANAAEPQRHQSPKQVLTRRVSARCQLTKWVDQTLRVLRRRFVQQPLRQPRHHRGHGRRQGANRAQRRQDVVGSNSRC